MTTGTCDLCLSHPATVGFLCERCAGLGITDPFDALEVEPLTVEQAVDFDIRARHIQGVLRALMMHSRLTGVWQLVGYPSWEAWCESLHRPHPLAPDGDGNVVGVDDE